MNPPRQVLSDALQRRIGGRTVETAVFLTFRFDPGFFEQEILPVIVDVPSQARSVKLLMLEDVLRDRLRHVAVYYDRNGLEAGASSAKLDVRRIAITQNGFFHPKNVLLLVRGEPTVENPAPSRSLILATLSANLTRAGWWENVEVCHIEEIASGDRTSLRSDILDMLRRLQQACRAEDNHEALDEIRDFLRRETSQYTTASAGGVLRPRLYAGGRSVPDFLWEALGRRLDGCNLEVISPYFDEATAAPLRELIERFSPREVRVLLPRDSAGIGLCSAAYWQAVLDLADESGIPVAWGRLPSALLTAGQGERAIHRRVHAKVYHFFAPKPAYEALFVGSVNLTTAGHSRGGNFETGMLVEVQDRRPNWWLDADQDRPIQFEREQEGEATPSARLGVRYHWERGQGAVFWDSASVSPPIEISANGPLLFRLEPLPPQSWLDLTSEQSAALKARLEQSSFLTVTAGDPPSATILIQEEGMAHKPSLIVSLPIEDILKYWALLTAEQKAAFLESRVNEVVENGVTVPTPPLGQVPSIFSTFAGIFQAFGALEERLDLGFDEGRLRQVEYYLFGKRYDSLPALLSRARDADEASDPVKLYVVALCAKQLVRTIRKERADFARARAADFRELGKAIDEALRVRRMLDLPPREGKAFLQWFEKWFLTPAPAVPVVID